MKLTLTLTDSRVKSTPRSQFAANAEYEEYERACIDGSGNARFLAQVLRGLADELDPPRDQIDKPTVGLLR